MATVSTVPAVDAIIKAVTRLLKDVIEKEDNCQILQTEFKPMENLVQDIGIFFRFQQKEAPEMVKIWLQLLHNSLTEAKGLLDQPWGQRQRCLDSVLCNPGRLSEKIRAWKAFFNHLFERFQIDWFYHIPLAGNAVNTHMVDPVIKLLEGVINKEDNRQIFQTDHLRRMANLVQDIATLFRDEPDITTLFQCQKRELLKIVKNWLQLLQNSVTEAHGLLDRSYRGRWQMAYSARRRIFGDRVVCEPKSLSNEIREWRASFHNIYDTIQSELSILVTSMEFILSKQLYEKKEIFPQEAATSSEFGGSGFMEARDKVEQWLNEGDHVHVISVYSTPYTGKIDLLDLLGDVEVSDIFEHVIVITVSQNYEILELQDHVADQIDLRLPSYFDERKMKLSAYLKEKNFLLLLDDLWSRLDLQEVGVAFGDGKHSKVVFSTRRKDLIPEMSAQQSTEIQPLSKDERWKLFRRVAFKDEQVSMDIEERARMIANDCEGLSMAVNVVTAAMVGKSSVHEWDNCLSSIREVDPSFPATHPRLDAHLYALLHYAYHSLPNSQPEELLSISCYVLLKL